MQLLQGSDGGMQSPWSLHRTKCHSLLSKMIFRLCRGTMMNKKLVSFSTGKF